MLFLNIKYYKILQYFNDIDFSDLIKIYTKIKKEKRINPDEALNYKLIIIKTYRIGTTLFKIERIFICNSLIK